MGAENNVISFKFLFIIGAMALMVTEGIHRLMYLIRVYIPHAVRGVVAELDPR
jgi:hypothetical protein